MDEDWGAVGDTWWRKGKRELEGLVDSHADGCYTHA